ncbi:hypothetical protein CNMCM8980_002894 [Aspergillus fumigatiaffinis]|nr:hypothetical protein CNMCM5878_010561 [Aspergillus fumigatiaffinis]KAF4249788.1 hypothetical protein CNMCM8980_002894 [Aspergillus fumigatiaffinis]
MSFYPPGWTYDRLLNASGDELQALSDSQRTTLFDGLRATHGEDGFRAILQEMSRRYRARVEAAKSEETKQQERELIAPFFKTLSSVYRNPAPEDWGKWGFVVFRTTPYGGEHESRWAEFRERWDAILEEQVAPHRELIAKVDRAIDLLELRWVEDPKLEGVDAAEVARRFGEMAATLPQGLATSACLMVTPASLESVLTSPLPSSTPRIERQKIPFVVAVARVESTPRLPPMPGADDADVAGTGFNGYLNVALETLLEEFYPIVALQMMDLHSLVAKFSHENDIWCSTGLRGMHQNADGTS